MTERPARRPLQDWIQLASWVIVAALAVTYMFTGWEPALYIGAAILLANAIARALPGFLEERKRPR